MSLEVQIEAAVEHVFDAMADVRNETSWNAQVSEAELLTDEPIQLGTKFRTVNRGQAYKATIAEHDRPGRLSFLVTGKSMDINAAFAFAESAGSTRLTGTFDLQPKGFMKVMLPLMSGAVRKDFPRQMASFKQFCESRAQAT